jgi:signal transduction histidine kinase/CHASE3 domain sensor protein
MKQIIRKKQFFIYRIVYFIAITLLILFTGISYKQIKALDNSTELVVHTHKINTELEKLFSHIKDAEAGQRGFLLTHDTLYLEPYTNSYFLITQSLSQLKYLLQDNPVQTQTLQVLYSLTIYRLNSMAAVLADLQMDSLTFKMSNEKYIEMRAELKRGKVLMDRIRLIVNKIQRAERILLRERMIKLDWNLWVAPIATLFLLLFSISVATLSYVKVRGDYLNQKTLIDQLRLQNATFNHGELASNQGTYSWNLKTGKINFSNQLFRIFDIERNDFELVKSDLLKFIHPDDVQLASAFFNYSNSSKTVRTSEYRIKLDSGEIKQIKGFSLLFESNSGATVIGTLQNITIRKNAENKQIRTNKELAKSIERQYSTDTFLNTLINTSPNGIWVYEAIRDEHQHIIDFIITFANEASALHSAVKPSELIGKRLLSLELGVMDTDYFDKLVDIINTGVKMEYEIYYDLPEKPRMWFYNYMEKMGDGVTVTFSNITQLKQDALKIESINKVLEHKNTELEKNNAELISFNHLASHDLQEPLRKIQVFISRLESSDAKHLSEEGIKYFERIQNAAQRMQKLITDLLVFSNAKYNNKQIDVVDLNSVILFVKEELAEQIKVKEVTITCTNLPTVNGVEFQLQQLFNNLIANAIKYAKTTVKPVIQIDCTKVAKNDHAELEHIDATLFHKISVSDNGIGFNQAHAQRVFKLFQRLHDKSYYQGTGIGLAICKKIVENHNGIITVESNENIGSTFYIYLPA